jgi:hypothetical protein
MRRIVGISQKTKRAWLDAVLDRLVQTTDEAQLRTFLDKHLNEELPGKESRAKSSGIILRIWSSIPPERVALRDRAMAMLPRISGQERIWLHWGMTAMAYPFFRDTAEVIGRLLALQDDFTTVQVQGRLLTTWGDRATTKEAAGKLINTLVDWEVLRSTKTKGHFLLARKMTASIPDLQLWLLEALLGASAADEIEAQQLLRLPESFPFTLSVGIAELRKQEGFDIHRQGLDMDMVSVRTVRPRPPVKSRLPIKKAKSSRPSLFDALPCEADEAKVAKPPALPTPPVEPMPTPIESNLDTDRQQVESAFRAEDQQTLAARVERALQVRGLSLVPYGPFAAPSAECLDHFRNGQYYGCIALVQGVTEAIVRYIWQLKLGKKRKSTGDFDKNLNAIHQKGFVPDEIRTKIDLIWADRNNYHHLNPSIDSPGRNLEDIAREKMFLLGDVESYFFAFSILNGRLVPKNPEYWQLSNGETLVYVRCWP